MKTGDYKNYNTEDFILDAHFRNYILKGDRTAEEIWKTLRSEDHDMARRMDEAASILVAMNGVYSQYHIEGQKMAESNYLSLKSGIQNTHRRLRRRVMVISAAAASIAILVLAVFFWPEARLFTEYVTGSSETQEILLPDGSIVYLNENSQLTINDQWSDGMREVALDGEAYFMVRSREDSNGEKIKFIVKAGDLDVEVLGTQFNVQTGDTVTNVALDEGVVKLIKGRNRETESYLEPGEVATYNRISKDISIRQKHLTAANNYWKPDVITFNQITLRDAIEKMETAFDVRFIAKDAEILNLEIDQLSVPSDNPNVFIETVKILFADKITLTIGSDSTIYEIQTMEDQSNH